MGVSFSGNDLYSKLPVIVGCRPNSPASKAGFKAGDQIVEIDGLPIERQAQLRQQINRRYAGDTLNVVVLRGEERIARDLQLVDQLEPFQRPFLGLLPKRDAPADAAGVAVRFVYPDSPAAKAGLQSGDVIVSLDGQGVANRDALLDRAGSVEIGETVKLDVRRAEQPLAIELKPIAEPDAVAGELPPHDAAAAPAGERPQVGQFSLKLPEYKNDCLAYVPENYDPHISYGLVVWLHPSGGTPDEELLKRWKEPCERLHLILLAPRAADPAKWMPPEAEFIAKTIAQTRQTYSIDPQRVVLCGSQAGGSIAYLVAIMHRDLIRAVVALDAPPVGKMPENDPANRLTLWVTTAKQATFAEQIRAGLEQLRSLKYTVTVKDQGDATRPLNDAEFAELLRWIDSLDKF